VITRRGQDLPEHAAQFVAEMTSGLVAVPPVA
jgi:hypothetical protein